MSKSVEMTEDENKMSRERNMIHLRTFNERPWDMLHMLHMKNDEREREKSLKSSASFVRWMSLFDAIDDERVPRFDNAY